MFSYRYAIIDPIYRLCYMYIDSRGMLYRMRYYFLPPVVTCSALDDPTDGAVQYSGVDVGAEAEYTCNEGFLLEGATTRVCRSDGSWSGEAPTCQRGLFTYKFY